MQWKIRDSERKSAVKIGLNEEFLDWPLHESAKEGEKHSEQTETRFHQVLEYYIFFSQLLPTTSI